MDKIFELLKKEEKRQAETLMMIPSENYTYSEVRQVVGSVLMQKYAEGQPSKRYYQGMENVDEIERICEERALVAFGLDPEKWGVNVQPYSGTPANLVVYNALLTPGDRIMGMYLPDGGHLSHGWEYKDKKLTLASKIYKVEFYHVDPKTQIFNYDAIEKQALLFKPKLIISGGTAYPRQIDHQRMSAIAKNAGAYYLADIAHEAGLIIGGANASPFPYADVVTMTTHKTLRGPRGAIIICRKELLDAVDSSIFPGMQGGPHIHTIAGIAIALEKTKTKEFKDYARRTVLNARRLAEDLMSKGYNIVSGGTDKHLVLADLRNKKLNGWFAAWALETVGIVANRNTVPYDTGSPFYPSGLRLGTPAITVRGMKEKEIDLISDWINAVITHVGERNIPEDKNERTKYLSRFKEELLKDLFYHNLKKEIASFALKYPIP